MEGELVCVLLSQMKIQSLMGKFRVSSAACECPSRKEYESEHWPNGIYEIDANQVWNDVKDNDDFEVLPPRGE